MESYTDQDIEKLVLQHSRYTPFKHQLEGIKRFIKQPYFANFSEMGTGKTKQAIDATQVLYARGAIDRVVVVAPASVRDVWFDPELGELKKHLWDNTPSRVIEYHTKSRRWKHGPRSVEMLDWVITNYEFIRSRARLNVLKGICGQKTLLILDESSAVKNHRSQQSKACLMLRRACGRVWELNGTPIENNPGDIYSQARILSSKILDCSSWTHFRARYAVMGGWMNKQVTSWRNLGDLQERLAPYVLRRLKKDCLDLPEKLPPVMFSVPLSTESWSIYKEMRDEMVAWLSHQTVSVSAQAGVKAMRLAQVTSGFLGGVHEVENLEVDDDIQDGRPPFLPSEQLNAPQFPELRPFIRSKDGVQETGNEKLIFTMNWIADQLAIDPALKLIIWCRFRPELQRLYVALTQRFDHVLRAKICGGQKKGERALALRYLDPRTAPSDPVVVFGTLGSGARGLNLAACHTVLYVSNDFRLGTYLQSTDRIHRPGQVHAVSYFDVVATGPQGQRTIDHVVLKARQKKEDLATWTTSAWVTALTAE